MGIRYINPTRQHHYSERMAITLTEDEWIQLTALQKLIERLGYSPSLEEIAEAWGYASKSTAKYHVDNLEALGCIRRTPGVPRSIRLQPIAVHLRIE